jgi:Uncharacterised nucleotidyltransferase
MRRDSPAPAADLPPSLWPVLYTLATRAAWPPADVASAERFVETAAREDLLPLLFAEPTPPAVVAAALEQRRALERVGERRAAIVRDAAGRLATTLAGEPFILLKGADYAWRLYGRPELRPMRDLDILVPAERLDVAAARILAAGYPQQFPAGPIARTRRYNERVFDLGAIRLDMHQAFLPPVRLRVDYREVWERRVPFDGPCRAFRLSDVDALVHHAVAMAKDEFAVPLVRFVDLWLLLRAAPELLEPAVQRALEWRARRPLYSALVTARRLFPELEDVVADRRLERLLGSRTRAFLDRRVLPPSDNWPGNVRLLRSTQLWRKFWLIDSLARRAGFLLYHASALLEGLWISRAARRAQARTPGSAPGT